MSVCPPACLRVPSLVGRAALHALHAVRCSARRGNALLETLPPWLGTALPALRALDVSFCTRLELSGLESLTALTTLALQASAQHAQRGGLTVLWRSPCSGACLERGAGGSAGPLL